VTIIIERICDHGDYFEIQPDRARNAITCFGRLGGHVVGFIANNSAVASGQIDVDAAFKIARFVRFCSIYNTPVVFIEDTTGFLPGRDQESRGIVQAGRAMLDAIIDIRTPRILLILRNAFGGAYAAFNSYATGADPHLPRSLALTAPWARDDTSFTEAFANLDHHFSDNWRLKANATLLNQDMPEFTQASYFGPINSATGLLTGPLSAIEDPLTNKQSMLDATLTGSFDWLGQKQEVMIGGDYQHRISRSNLLEPNSSGPAIDPFAFDPQLYPAPDSSQVQGGLGLNILKKTIQWGVYGAVRFRPIESLSLLAGGRRSDYRSNENLNITYSGQLLQNSTSGYNDSGKFTPYAGITYDLSAHYTLYASYADIYHTNNGVLTKDFKQLPPSDGVNMETGIKGSWYRNTLNASLALFKIDQSGVATSDPTVPSSPTCCYVTQSQKSKGFETEVTGTLLPNWQVTAGYTYDDHRNASAYYVAELPKSLFKLWTNYRLPIADERWSVGGGVRAQSANHVTQCVAFAVNGCAGFVMRPGSRRRAIGKW